MALLRVKDGMPFVEEWLREVSPLVDEIVVVDNGSTDRTLDALRGCRNVVEIRSTQGFDEGRDKRLLYDMARGRSADWMLWLDVDEWFEEGVTRGSLEALMDDSRYTQYRFRRFHFADRARINASPYWLWYSSRHDRVMWLDQPTGTFIDAKFNNGVVVGISGRTRRTHIRLKHMGSVYAGPLRRKIELYRRLDPSLEKTYRRIGRQSRVLVDWDERGKHPYRVAALDKALDVLQVIRAVRSRLRTVVTRGASE